MTKHTSLNLTGVNSSVVGKIVHILDNTRCSVQKRNADAVFKVKHLTHLTYSEAQDVVNYIRNFKSNINNPAKG